MIASLAASITQASVICLQIVKNRSLSKTILGNQYRGLLKFQFAWLNIILATTTGIAFVIAASSLMDAAAVLATSNSAAGGVQWMQPWETISSLLCFFSTGLVLIIKVRTIY